MEAYPDFELEDIGNESIDWTRVLGAIGAGSGLGLMMYGVVKFIQWVRGASSSGGGGGSDAESKIVSETQDLIKKTSQSVAAAYTAQQTAFKSAAGDIDDMFENMGSFLGKARLATKLTGNGPNLSKEEKVMVECRTKIFKHFN